MDFRLYARVLWRFKPIVLLGLIAAIALAGLSIVKVTSSGKVSYRSSELWSSTTRLGVTQAGFPWGRLFAQQPTVGGQQLTPGQQAAKLGIPIADPNRLNNLAVLYSELATSDLVRAVMRRDGPVSGQILATSLTIGDNRIMLPMLDLTAISDSPQAAEELAGRAGNALTTYVEEQQRASDAPKADRVVVQRVTKPAPATVFQPRSKTMPAVVFLAVMLATVGFCFLLENLRPRKREQEHPAEASLPQDTKHRRTA